MAVVAQSVECLIVIQDVAGSSPVDRPPFSQQTIPNKPPLWKKFSFSIGENFAKLLLRRYFLEKTAAVLKSTFPVKAFFQPRRRSAPICNSAAVIENSASFPIGYFL